MNGLYVEPFGELLRAEELRPGIWYLYEGDFRYRHGNTVRNPSGRICPIGRPIYRRLRMKAGALKGRGRVVYDGPPGYLYLSSHGPVWFVHGLPYYLNGGPATGPFYTCGFVSKPRLNPHRIMAASIGIKCGAYVEIPDGRVQKVKSITDEGRVNGTWPWWLCKVATTVKFKGVTFNRHDVERLNLQWQQSNHPQS